MTQCVYCLDTAEVFPGPNNFGTCDVHFWIEIQCGGQMAIGKQKNTGPSMSKYATGSTSDDSSSLEKTIVTLKRCLEIAGVNNSSVNKNEKSATNDDLNEVTLEEAVPEASKWPHCQHMISQDEARSDESSMIKLVPYKDESQIGDIMRLITKDLSEPYSIYTYRYFLHNWPELSFLAYDVAHNVYVGAVLGKLEIDENNRRKGYVAMLAVDESCRRLGLGTRLVRRTIDAMQQKGCDEVGLETEVSNKNAQRLYSNLGFMRQKRLIRYYLNGGDAFRLKLLFNAPRRQRGFISENKNHEIDLDDLEVNNRENAVNQEM